MISARDLSTTGHNPDMLVSIAIIVRDMDQFEARLDQLSATMRQDFRYSEILLIDNGSRGLAADRVDAILQRLPNIRRLRLSRAYPVEIAVTAALDHSIGDYVVLMDLATDPPELIAPLAALASTGHDAVVAVPESPRTGWFIRRVYALVSHFVHFELVPEDTYFRVFSRRLVNSIVKIRSKNRYLGSLNGIAGFQHCTVSYKPMSSRVENRAGRSFRLLRAASDILVCNSAAPLRFASALGVLASVANGFYLLYILGVTLVKKKIAEGWLTTSLTQTAMFLILFLIIAIVAEYLALVLHESKEQPLYFVASEASSTVAAPQPERLNVVL